MLRIAQGGVVVDIGHYWPPITFPGQLSVASALWWAHPPPHCSDRGSQRVRQRVYLVSSSFFSVPSSSAFVTTANTHHRSEATKPKRTPIITATIIISPLHSCLALTSAACLADRVRGQRSALCVHLPHKMTWRSEANPPDAANFIPGPDLAKRNRSAQIRGHGRDAYATSLGTDADARSILSHDQLH